jgi:uncharacterized protein
MRQKQHNKNHLKGQTSPYLLQHVHNPVDWYPWGDEALLKAKKEDKPMLVSIGYSACHWCHVMERESFEDEAVAKIMNEYFVCVKVDREERPDVDRLYMDAVQLVGGQGGWPLNCFALPDGRPFWGGTYFPRDQWKGILVRVAELYRDKHEDVVQQAARLTEGIASNGFIPPVKETAAFSREDIHAVFKTIMEGMDRHEGGTSGAPKFPLPAIYEFLLHYHAMEGEEEALNLCSLGLDKMAMGGIYDQLGGGFARYATDGEWRIPHFEKMLYDNAQLVSTYCKAYQVTKAPLYREVVFDTIGFVQRELMSADGLFHAALDADSEGVEGRFYVWTEKELDEVLGESSIWIRKYYQAGGKGFWEKGLNILIPDGPPAVFAEKSGLNPGTFAATLEKAREKLFEARGKRTRPALDNKVLVSWNALMIKALADAYAVFREPAFLDSAMHAARMIIKYGMDDGRLYRKIEGRLPSVDGFLDDYSLFIQALIRLYEVSMEEEFVQTAQTLTIYVEKHFSRPGTNLFSFSSDASEALAATAFDIHDNVIPAANSVMAHNLFSLGMLFEKRAWTERSAMMLQDMMVRLKRFSLSFSNWGTLLMNHVHPFYTVVVAGKNARGILAGLAAGYLPGTILAGADVPPVKLPVFEQRFSGEETRIYVCSMGTCKQPVTTVREALRQIRGPGQPL